MKITVAACVCIPGTFYDFLKAIVNVDESLAELICLFNNANSDGKIDQESDLVIHDNCQDRWPFWEEVRKFERNGGSVIRLRDENGDFKSLGCLRTEIAERCGQIRERRREV